jgi:TonB-dependent receptor
MTNENINNTSGIKIGEQTRENDSYKANTLLSGTYANAEINIKQQLKIVAGFRFEYFQQNLTTPLGSTKVKNTKLAYLPSVNISYNITPKTVIRGAYGMSVNRPEFREIAPFAFDDFYTGYAIIGNTDLKNCTIHNVDAKLEYYPTNSEIISASFFYKKFINPIESKAIVGAAREFTFVNAASANVYGVEVEIKKNFAASKNSFFQHFGLMANATYVYSKINLGKESVGQSNNRPLQGQAPYSINSGVFYENKELGLQVNLLYNVVGKRIVYVGTDDYPDIYEMPRHTLDFNASYRFKKGIELSLNLKDLVNQDVILIQDGNGDKKWNKKTDQVFQKYKPGQTISLGVKYTF